MNTTLARLHQMDRATLLDLAGEVDWYHVVDLGDGVETDGVFDIRPVLDQYRLPADLRGKDVLDIGRASGFFSFEFERRGARVVATDLPSSLDKEFVGGPITREVWRRWLVDRVGEVPAEEGMLGERMDFAVAHAALRSNVEPLSLRISELSPEAVGGRQFDVVFLGSILNHIKDPAGALERVFQVTRDLCIVANPIDPDDTSSTPRLKLIGRSAPSLTAWWLPNVACLRELLYCAGFEEVEVVAPEVVLRGRGAKYGKMAIPHAILHARKPPDIETTIERWARTAREKGAKPPVFAGRIKIL